jgi:hypothetical protein
MTPLLRLVLVAALALLAGCVVAPYPGAYPITASTPPSFDRSWDAALGAAGDAGIQVSNADRASGRITGNKGGAAVTIELATGRQQPEGELRRTGFEGNQPDAR